MRQEKWKQKLYYKYPKFYMERKNETKHYTNTKYKWRSLSPLLPTKHHLRSFRQPLMYLKSCYDGICSWDKDLLKHLCKKHFNKFSFFFRKSLDVKCSNTVHFQDWQFKASDQNQGKVQLYHWLLGLSNICLRLLPFPVHESPKSLIPSHIFPSLLRLSSTALSFSR